MSEEFSDAPLSVTEVRAERMGDGGIWTPKDVLIKTLREIDSGEQDVQALIVVYRTKDETTVYSAKAGRHQAVGLLTQAANMVLR